MKIYDEITHEELTNPDLENGCLYDGTIVTGYTEPYEKVLEGTVDDDHPNGFKTLVPAQPIIEECQYYHTYTEEKKNPPSPSGSDDIWKEMADAYRSGVNTV